LTHYSYPKETIKEILKKATKDEKYAKFMRGLSEYILTTFYVKKKKDHMSEEIQAKFKSTFDIINKVQEA